MHGIGNDFVMLNRVGASGEETWPELATRMCSRRFGVGADGLILLEPSAAADLAMRMFNPDGSESEMCGNGIRCLALFAKKEGLLAGDEFRAETGAGILGLSIVGDNKVRVDMGTAKFSPAEVGMTSSGDAFIDAPIGFESLLGTAVSMGNPHLVVFTPDAAAIPLQDWGPMIEHSALFTNRTNVHFIQVVSRNELIQRTWERGAGITLACGTGACASAAAAVITDRADRDILMHLPGGDLRLEVAEDMGVHMTGPAAFVFEAEWPLD